MSTELYASSVHQINYIMIKEIVQYKVYIVQIKNLLIQLVNNIINLKQIISDLL